MAQEQQTQDYRGPGYVGSAVGKGATYGAVTGAVVGAAAVGGEMISPSLDATDKGPKAAFERVTNVVKEGLNNTFTKDGREAVKNAKEAAKKAGKEATKAVKPNMLTRAVLPLAAVGVGLGAIGGLVATGRAKADQQLAAGRVHDAEREVQSLRRENSALVDQTKTMAAEMEEVAEAVKSTAKSHVEKAGAHKHKSHAAAAEASKEAAEAESLAI